MPNDQSTTPILQDVWTGCYSSSWRDLIVPEAYSHPAKFSRNLIQKIYQHCADELWLKPGDTVLDCFSGTGLGGLDAALAGYRFIGCELELRFHALAHGFDCGGDTARHEACSQQDTHAAHHVTGNLELWARRYGHLSQYVAPTLLQGDSRHLGTILREQVQCCVSSPPFQQSDGRKGGSDLYVNNQLRRGRSPDKPHMRSHETTTPYGTTEGQLAALPPGTLDACLSSPPFLHTTGGCRPASDPDGHINATLRARHAATGTNTYGTHPAQLGNLPAGQVEAVIASPPYADGCHRTGGPHTPPAVRGDGTAFREGQSMAFTHYGSDPAQLGNLPAGQVAAVVSSPPWETCLAGTAGAHAPHDTTGRLTDQYKEPPVGSAYTDVSQRKRLPDGTWPRQREAAFYNNLGQAQADTFWSAAREIVAQVFDLLKPNGIAIFVVKDYVRDGAIVPFSQQWRTLAEHCGFVTVHIHHALLVEDHGTQHDLLQPDTPDRKPTSTPDDLLKPLVSTSTYAVHNQARRLHTKRVSFFRRLHERKRPDLAIDHETVLCLRKPADSPGGEIAAVCASPPYAESNQDYTNGWRYIDLSKRKAGPHTGTKQTSYGTTEGQLGSMREGPRPSPEETTP